MTGESIVAMATPQSQSSVGVVRVSGPICEVLARRICGGDLQPRAPTLRSFRASNGEVIDQGLVMLFKGPASFTGEDVLEFQGHGSPIAMSWLLEECLLCASDETPLRLARPGEFSERAFLNGKLDLTAAEAIADLISARSRGAVRAAVQSMTGRFSNRINEIQRLITEARARLEACLDFPDEEGVAHLQDQDLLVRLRAIDEQLRECLASAQRGVEALRGRQAVLVGKPNVGKSSLFNALADEDLAIVSELAGTTRDRLANEIRVAGHSLRVLDTAGLRFTDEPIEQIGVTRSQEAMGAADLVIWVRDLTSRDVSEFERSALVALPKDVEIWVVWNKLDALESVSREDLPLESLDSGRSLRNFYLSAADGGGLASFIEALGSFLAGVPSQESVFSARQRHLVVLVEVLKLVEFAVPLVGASGELAADQLRLAQEKLGEITGEFHSDDLLGAIFSSFCIGK